MILHCVIEIMRVYYYNNDYSGRALFVRGKRVFDSTRTKMAEKKVRIVIDVHKSRSNFFIKLTRLSRRLWKYDTKKSGKRM